MGDHVRKYDDWNIVRNDRATTPAPQAQPVEDEAQNTPAEFSSPDPMAPNNAPADNSVFEAGDAIVNPFAARPTQNDVGVDAQLGNDSSAGPADTKTETQAADSSTSAKTAAPDFTLPGAADPVQNDARNDTVLEPGEPIVNPFAPSSDANQVAPRVETASKAPTAPTPSTTNHDDMVDPDTGLPIPDYMKPFLSGNE